MKFRAVLFVLGIFALIGWLDSGGLATTTKQPPPLSVDSGSTIAIAPMHYDFGFELPQAAQLKPHVLKVQNVETPVLEATDTKGFLLQHWRSILAALLVFIESILRLTPSEKDNSIFNIIKRILDYFLPNKDPTGGVHP